MDKQLSWRNLRNTVLIKKKRKEKRQEPLEKWNSGIWAGEKENDMDLQKLRYIDACLPALHPNFPYTDKAPPQGRATGPKELNAWQLVVLLAVDHLSEFVRRGFPPLLTDCNSFAVWSEGVGGAAKHEREVSKKKTENLSDYEPK